MKNIATAAGDAKPHARWFADPFRYAEVNRAMNAAKRRRGIVSNLMEKSR